MDSKYALNTLLGKGFSEGLVGMRYRCRDTISYQFLLLKSESSQLGGKFGRSACTVEIDFRHEL